VFAVVSRQVLIDSKFSTVVCAPVYTARHGLSTQVLVGSDEGLKHECALHCDELISLLKAGLTDYVGSLAPPKPRARAYLTERGAFRFSIITRYEILRGLKAKNAVKETDAFHRLHHASESCR
jgi:mRNA interferase MazF